MHDINDINDMHHDDDHGRGGHHDRGGRRGFGGFGPARAHHGGPGAHGFGPGFGPGGRGFGHGGPGFMPGFGFGREGRRARRGDVRLAVLGLLADGPANGYTLIKAIAERTGGSWRPSPGSVYPTLQQLVDEGLIVATGDDGRSVYELTDTGRAEVEARAEDIDRAWQSTPGMTDPQREFVEALQKTFGVLHMYRSTATEEQMAAATAKIEQLRRELLQILAD